MSDKEEDFTRVFIWVLASLVLFTIVVMLVARSVGLDENSGPMTDQDINERTKPYGTIKVAGQAPAETAPAAVAPAETAPAAVAPAEATPVAAAPAEAAPVAAAPAEAATAIDGKALYAPCAICHAAGVAQAPILGNVDQWAPRIALGIDALVDTAIKGKGAMPPRGTRADYSDAQIRAVVEYMVNASK